MPPHNRAAGVRALYRQKKKRHLRSFFGASAWYAAPHFSNALRDSDSRKIALCVNLFTLSQRVQFGRSVVAHSAAAQSCGRGPRLKQTQKKEHMCVPFWLFGVVHLNIKKRTLVCSFLARLWIKWTNSFDKKKKQIRSAFLFR